MEDIITVEHLSKKYNQNTILNDINLTIQSGQIIALLGKNGAGKTTLINIMLNLISHDSGSISILPNSKHPKEHIGVMMQDNIALTRITVKEIIELTRSYYKTPKTYQELIEISGLKQFEHSKMSQLSGGQKRHLAFSLAIAGDPELLFLDEPTSGMDSKSRIDFWQEILQLKKQGKTIFVTSHYLEELENVADRIIILKDHQIKFDDSIAQLRSLQGQSLIEFDSNLLDVFENLTNIKKLNHFGTHYQLITSDPELLMQELSPYLKGVTNLKVHQNSLDSLFNSFEEGKKND